LWFVDIYDKIFYGIKGLLLYTNLLEESEFYMKKKKTSLTTTTTIKKQQQNIKLFVRIVWLIITKKFA
jgi:hypothetical protein